MVISSPQKTKDSVLLMYRTPNTCTRHTHHFNGHFAGKHGLASCPIDTQSPVILILSILIR